MSQRPARLTIEPARPGDEKTVLRFVRELAAYEKLEHEVVATADDFARWLFGPQAHVGCLIARRGAEPVGFALYFFNFSTFLGKPGLYLEDLYVTPEQRGSGVGRALLARLARIAVERGCGRMEWWVLDWNEPSIEFYRRLGAESMDDWTVFRLTGEPLRALAGDQSADQS